MSENKPRRQWTLRGRMLKWLGLTSGVVAVSLSATGIWFVNSSANQQIEALLIEELDEVRTVFAFHEVNGTAFMSAADELARLHPSSQFAWRVWAPGAGSLIGEFGVGHTLHAGAPAVLPLDKTVSVAGGYRWRSTMLDTGEIVGLMLDESPHRLFVDQYVLMTVLIVVGGFACIFLVGQAFSTKVSRLLSRIAERVGEAQVSTDPIDLAVEDLPQEISEVAVALEGMLHNIRTETRTSRVLIAGMAHELRAPIQNLIGETEVTLLAERSGERYRDVLVSHLDELRDLGDAVHNLVSLCSAKKSAEAKQSESFDLFREVRYRLEREARRANRMGVTLNFAVHGGMDVRGDREALLTALRNLASNALDWIPEKGRVDIEFRGLDEQIEITIDDDGPGVPKDVRTRIFEPFFRAPSAQGKRQGYGLGLALAHSAVVAQGGTIVVGDSPLGGARFHLLLPRERSVSSSAPSLAEPRAMDLDA